MSAPRALYDSQKRIFADHLRSCERHHGSAATGVVIEAGLAAIREHLTEMQGAEAAFNTITRHADMAIEPVLPARLSTKHGDR